MYFVMPKTKIEFWQAKIERNKERDFEIQRPFASMRWHGTTIWKCQLRPKKRLNIGIPFIYVIFHPSQKNYKAKNGLHEK